MRISYRSSGGKNHRSNFINASHRDVPAGFKTIDNLKTHRCLVLGYYISRCRVVTCSHYSTCCRVSVKSCSDSECPEKHICSVSGT